MSSSVVLDAYGDVPAFRAVKDESEQVIGRLKKKLSDRLDSADTCREDLHEAASLLLQLKEPQESLLRKYLIVRERRLQLCIKSTIESWSAPKPAIVAGSTKGEDSVSLLSSKVLEEAKDFLLSFHDLVPNGSAGTEKESAGEAEAKEEAGAAHHDKGDDGGTGRVTADAMEAVSRCLDAYWRGAVVGRRVAFAAAHTPSVVSRRAGRGGRRRGNSCGKAARSRAHTTQAHVQRLRRCGRVTASGEGRRFDGGRAGLRGRGEAGGGEVEPGPDAGAVRAAMESLYDLAKCIDAVAPVPPPPQFNAQALGGGVEGGPGWRGPRGSFPGAATLAGAGRGRR